MNKLHKANAALIKDKITTFQNDLSIRKTQYDEKNRTFNLLQQIDADHATAIKNNIRVLKERLELNEKQCAELQADIDNIGAVELRAELMEHKTDINAVRSSIRSIEVDIDQAEKKKVYFETHTDCDKCHQGITKKQAQTNVKRLLSEIESFNTELEAYHEKVNSVNAKMEFIEAQLLISTELETELTFAKRSTSVIATDIRKKLSELDVPNAAGGESEKIKEEVDSIKTKIKQVANKYEKVCAARDITNVATDLLKDTGIKSQIIKQYIPLLVGYVNHYLEQLNISIKFSMDENFNESITTRYANEYQYQNLSMGERARLDLAMAFAWRQIAKLKGSVYCNVLILDEVLDASLDLNGTEDALSILEEVCVDASVFIISHKNNLDEKVRSVIRLEKQNGFTKIL